MRSRFMTWLLYKTPVGPALGGTLDLIAPTSLTANQRWTVMTYGCNPGPTDFNTVNFPDGNHRWTEGAGVNAVTVRN
jgi:hypothetical protein